MASLCQEQTPSVYLLEPPLEVYWGIPQEYFCPQGQVQRGLISLCPQGLPLPFPRPHLMHHSPRQCACPSPLPAPPTCPTLRAKGRWTWKLRVNLPPMMFRPDLEIWRKIVDLYRKGNNNNSSNHLMTGHPNQEEDLDQPLAAQIFVEDLDL